VGIINEYGTTKALKVLKALKEGLFTLKKNNPTAG
jgi:hypothetical protein